MGSIRAGQSERPTASQGLVLPEHLRYRARIRQPRRLEENIVECSFFALALAGCGYPPLLHERLDGFHTVVLDGAADAAVLQRCYVWSASLRDVVSASGK